MSLQSAQITFRHIPSSPAIEARIQEEVAGLSRYFDRITSCHVVIDAPHHHHRPQGRTWHITIQINVPGGTIVVNHEPSLHAAVGMEQVDSVHKHHEPHADHRDVYVCIRDAFSAARRQIEDYSRKLRGDVKHHHDQAHP
jgi:ribosome-associated translation inhibitor RaiA